MHILMTLVMTWQVSYERKYVVHHMDDISVQCATRPVNAPLIAVACCYRDTSDDLLAVIKHLTCHGL